MSGERSSSKALEAARAELNMTGSSSESDESSVLWRALREGISGEHLIALRRSFRFDANDDELAQMVAEVVCESGVASLRLETRGESRLERSQKLKSASTASADTSLMGQLELAQDLESVEFETLVALVVGAKFRLKRRVLRRLEALVQGKELKGEELRLLTRTVQRPGDLETEYERQRLERMLASRRAQRTEAESWRQRMDTLSEQIVEFWEAASPEEPLSLIPSEERALLILRLRDAPDDVVAHVCALVEAAEGEQLQRLVASLRHAADPRLVPTLRDLLDQPASIAREAARGLGLIDDPRAQVALEEAYEFAVRDSLRMVIAGALSRHGDLRARPAVREVLGRQEARHMLFVLEALETLGEPEDSKLAVSWVTHEDHNMRSQAIRTLGRIADGRVLPELNRIIHSTTSFALRAELEEAQNAIVARMELRGEEAPEDTQAHQALTSDVKPRVGGKRFAALWSFLIAHLWLLFGATKRAFRRFDRAAALRPHWAVPHIVKGTVLTRRGNHAKALASFRRALEVDRSKVERNVLAIRALARSFIARAEQAEQGGRLDLASGLLEEALSLDLRYASGPQRLEIERRRREMRRRRLNTRRSEGQLAGETAAPEPAAP